MSTCLQSVPISLEHRDLLNARFEKMGLSISDYSFASAYLFKKHHTEVISCHDIYLQGRMEDGFSYITPTTFAWKCDLKELEGFMHTFDGLYPIPEEWLKFFDEKHYDFTAREKDADYLFTLNKLRFYPGRKLSGKRNLVKQFKELYPSAQVFPLTSERLADALILLNLWLEQRNEGIENDYLACKEALDQFNTLKLQGIICYVDFLPVGFILGESLNLSTMDFHFAKADRRIKGIYQYLYQFYALLLDDHCRYINLENDLGIPALIQAKNSYEPDLLLKKFRITLKS